MLLGTVFSRHCPEEFVATRRISNKPVSPNAVLCCDLSGASVDDAAAFGPEAHRPPKLVLCCARMLPGKAFPRHGDRKIRGTRRISGDPVSPYAVRSRDVLGASVYDPAAFGPQAHRPPSRDLVLAVPSCSPESSLTKWHVVSKSVMRFYR